MGEADDGYRNGGRGFVQAPNCELGSMSSVVPLNVSRPYLKNEGRPFWCSAGSALLGLDIRKERRQEGG